MASRVGQAYVDVAVRGDDVNDGITEQFEDVDYNRLGDRAGEEFAGRVRQRLDKAFSQGLYDSMSRVGASIENDNAISRGVRHQLANAADAGFLDRIFEEVGERAGIQMGEGMDPQVRRAVSDSLERRLHKIARDSNLDFGSLVRGMVTDAGQIDLPGDFLDEATRDIEKVVKRWEEASEENSRIAAKFQEARQRLHEKSNDAIADSDQKLRERQQALMDRLTKEEENRVNQLWRVRRQTYEARLRYERELRQGRMTDQGEEVIRQGRGRFGDRIGRAFGMGSRNNALNLLGRTIGRTTGLMERFRRSAAGGFRVFAQGAAQAGESATTLQKAMAGFSTAGRAAATRLAAVGRAAAASGPAAAVAVVAVVTAMSVLASSVGALIGIVTALAGTIASSLVGALTVGTGALLAAGTAAGLLTVAFTSMTNAQREALDSAFRPLKAELTGLGQLMIRDMVPAFDTWSSNLQEALLLLTPLAQNMGEVFAEAGNRITSALSGPGFQRLAISLGEHLPNIVRNLSSAFGDLLNGLTGMFAAIMPMVQRFSGYLADVAERFSNWANSAEGQTAIEDFVNRSVESLQSLWGFVREFFGFLQDLLFDPATQQAGNTMFDGMRDAFERFRQAIASGDLERWFNDAIAFGSALWEVMESLGGTFIALYDSGVIASIAQSLAFLADVIEFLNPYIELTTTLIGGLGQIMTAPLGPIGTLIGRLQDLGSTISAISRVAASSGLSVIFGGGGGGGSGLGDVVQPPAGSPMFGPANNTYTDPGNPGYSPPSFDASSLINIGSNALDNTYQSAGGNMPDPSSGTNAWQNPWEDWAESLIKEGPSMAQEMREAVEDVNKQVLDAIDAANAADTRKGARQGLKGIAQEVRQAGRSLVEDARDNFNQAARRLSNAASPEAARKARRELDKAWEALFDARDQRQDLKAVASDLKEQRKVNQDVVSDLMDGVMNQNATLADYAVARKRVANRLDAANERLTEAIQMRDEYREQVTESIREFGSLISAQAETINGVEQSLTAGDITGHLEDRLSKIRDFQTQLRQLLAMGLSRDAYKQIVDAGVEEGGAFASALLEGGVGSIQQVNSLTSQVNSAAEGLGSEASNQMYQAGVNAAEGLVEGLESLSERLDSAASRLGNSIANSIAKSLGISSPALRLRRMMGDAGDGVVLGLDDQQPKVGAAAERMADQIAVGTAAATRSSNREAQPPDDGVSGNNQKFRDLVVQTPTDKPEAVAHEVLNEVTGRL